MSPLCLAIRTTPRDLVAMDKVIAERRIGALPLSIEELQLVERAADRTGVAWERFFVTAGVEKAAKMLVAEPPMLLATAFMPVI
jgi:uncharacterized protein (DUF1778 family)